jgi:hypothetical protein
MIHINTNPHAHLQRQGREQPETHFLQCVMILPLLEDCMVLAKGT